MAILEAPKGLQVSVGQEMAGGIVKELKMLDDELVSASYLAKKFGKDKKTIRKILEKIDQGSSGKSMYNLSLAEEILLNSTSSGRGRPRKN